MGVGQMENRKREGNSIFPYLYFKVSSYALLSAIGLGAAFVYLYKKRAQLRWNIAIFAEYIVVCTVFAVVFARVMFVIALLPSMESVLISELFYQLINGGIVFYGGLFGVLVGIVFVSKHKKRNSLETLDSITPVFPLFHSFARIGCFLAGCCYGVECSWGIGMISDPSVSRFPVQIVESLCNVAIFIVLLVMEKKRKTSEGNLRFYLCTYAICRFILEFFRGDEIRGLWFGCISTAQCVSLIILMINCVVWLKKHSDNLLSIKKQDTDCE